MLPLGRHQLPRVYLVSQPLRTAGLRLYSHTAEGASRKRIRPLVYGAFVTGAVAATYLLWPNESRSAPTYSNELLSPTHFTPATLVASEPCTDSETRLLTLAVPPYLLPSREELMFNPIWSIFVKDDDIQVERPYTPLEGIDDEGRMKFWIKKYPKGEVGRWLHSKKVGDKIEIRGPLKTWPWQDGKWDEVVMISGGTGITPFYQLLHHTILQNPSRYLNTRFTLLHASRRPLELPPPQMLAPLLSSAQEHPERLNVVLHVDTLEGPEHPLVASSVLRVGRINQRAIESALEVDKRKESWWRSLLPIGAKAGPERQESKRILYLVCGPEPMIAAIAGPFGRDFSQGVVGGILGSMGCTKDQVYKL
ncbi:ferredoxin reductase-like C-terminal NADP-linked domain-containing protein [Wolfiporia cocos MD-104 SS10]|uniref:Ferredoxin reductase-like C-terminal NADP-linked domain-containing protein n=1 Tax=Wolfiporia cocos (strain MD-104) TaxID=742152 RepID=A0A2H3JGX9_WOLCO|nr:ferredoxin reductase-like C-terminal NADP-linked domain-containing protein [Wolfiporia cocos MD-104 SS10]